MAAIVRAAIWSYSVMAAGLVFAFVGPLEPLEKGTTYAERFSFWSYLLAWVFRGGMLWWMYVIVRGLVPEL